MIDYDCDAVRDLLPAFARGELLPHEELAAQQHLDGCANCAREAVLVRLLQRSLEPVPAGLEARVLSALRGTPQPSASVPVRRGVPARLAMAAALAAALIGGALAVNQFTGAGDEPDMLLMAEFELPGAALIGWIADDDPLLHGGATLDELTVEELELLLAELES